MEFKLLLNIANCQYILPIARLERKYLMEVLIDNFGRILIPQSVRKHIGLKPGAVLDIVESDNKIVLKPKEEQSPLRIKEDLAVYSGDIGDSEDLVKDAREKRIRKLTGN